MTTQTRTSPIAALTYYCSLPFIYLLASLPFKLLYLFSDFVFLLLFHITGYRKEVVLQNLRNSFPNKSKQELDAICREFYHNLCDFLLEIIKTITLSKKSLQERCKFSPEAAALFAKYAGEGKSIIMAMGHLGNWEWACNSFNLLSGQQLYVIYHPISNKYFDGLMHRLRTRTGAKLIAMNNTYREMIDHRNEVTATAFVADQTPAPDHAYWIPFLNQDTPVFKGVEVLAKKMELPVVYTAVRKTDRGHYEMHAEVLTESPKEMPDGAISELYMRRLEKDIIIQPETWLWTHRRWKHKRNNTFA